MVCFIGVQNYRSTVAYAVYPLVSFSHGYCKFALGNNYMRLLHFLFTVVDD